MSKPFPDDSSEIVDPFTRYEDTVWFAYYRHDPVDVGPYWTMAGAISGADCAEGTQLEWRVHPNGVPAGFIDGYEVIHVRAVHVHP